MTGDREHLAAVSHSRKAAKHKGRNHWANWKRRAMLAEKRAAARKVEVKRDKRFAVVKRQIRAYWLGDRTEHPTQ